MDSATIILVTVFIVLFFLLVLAPMLWLLITTGIEIRQTQERIRKNDEEIKRLINRM